MSGRWAVQIPGTNTTSLVLTNAIHAQKPVSLKVIKQISPRLQNLQMVEVAGSNSRWFLKISTEGDISKEGDNSLAGQGNLSAGVRHKLRITNVESVPNTWFYCDLNAKVLTMRVARG